jgi:DNA-binding winged helix-turn-helix (wHTH) protein
VQKNVPNCHHKMYINEDANAEKNAKPDGKTAIAKPEALAPLQHLVPEAYALFGAHHYGRYDFLLTLSDAESAERLAAPSVTHGDTLTAGDISIDRSALRATIGGRELELTATEYKLLLTLIERRGRVQTRPQLLETVWEDQPDIQTRTVDMHIQRLRTKLGDAGRMIETVRGFGYRFRATDRAGRHA